MRLIHQSDYTLEERLMYKPIVYANAIQSMSIILNAVEKLSKGAFINDVTQIWPKTDPSSFVRLKWLFYLHLFTECHTIEYPPSLPTPYLRDIIDIIYEWYLG